MNLAGPPRLGETAKPTLGYVRILYSAFLCVLHVDTGFITTTVPRLLIKIFCRKKGVVSKLLYLIVEMVLIDIV